MKRTLSIALIAILLLNILGYYGVFLGIEYHHNAKIVRALDAEAYDVSETVTFHVPITIPYMPDNTDFQRVSGVFEYEGQHYQLIKQKYAKDTLTVVCFVDTEKKRINEQLSNYVGTFSDKTSDHPNTDSKALSFIKDYLFSTTAIKSLSFGWEKNVLCPSYLQNLVPSFEPSIIRPPERLA